MRAALAEHLMHKKVAVPARGRGPLRLVGDRVDAVVIDEHRRPVERVPGATALRIAGTEVAMKSDLPLLPGSHVLLAVTRSAGGRAGRQVELEVVGCKKRHRGHEVLARIVKPKPGKLLKAA